MVDNVRKTQIIDTNLKLMKKLSIKALINKLPNLQRLQKKARTFYTV